MSLGERTSVIIDRIFLGRVIILHRSEGEDIERKDKPFPRFGIQDSVALFMCSMNQKLAEDVTEITYSTGHRLFLRRRLISRKWNVVFGKRFNNCKDVTGRTGFRLHHSYRRFGFRSFTLGCTNGSMEIVINNS